MIMGKGSCAPSQSPSLAAAAAAAAAVICCMCGDHGLPGELFKCKICLARSQHKYCSKLYPRAATYRACNWCLREEHAARPHAGDDRDHQKMVVAVSSSVDGNSAALRRSSFVSQVDKPIKKPRAPERAPEEVSPEMGRVRRGFRGKVRRYKLLEDVTGK